jgi:hypothetical protein
MRSPFIAACAALGVLLSSAPALAQSDADLAALKSEIRQLRELYESRIADLESKIDKLEGAQVEPASPAPAASFNPAIGLVLYGEYRSFSQDAGTIAGFAAGEEGERRREGFSVDHTEMNLSANVDDKFRGDATVALAEHDGATVIELEEAFVQTLPGMGLPTGLGLKAGRAFWTLGYLNEHHRHADDFVDRALPYRVFLNGGFNDDGVEASYVLPTDLYAEIGGGVFRGNDFPFGQAAGARIGAWSAFARIGGDIGENQSWRIGGYVLSGDGFDRASNEDAVRFTGDTNLYAADVRYAWAPGGNSREHELTLQAEYFWRGEDGAYEDVDSGVGPIAFNGDSTGWYAQSVYKFRRQWRAGYRYSRLHAPEVPKGLMASALDSGGFDPDAHAVMVDWTNSEFSRLRLQYNREEAARGLTDNQFLVQYIMSIGAHGAHKF